jgi:uridylate kinase
LKKFIKLICNYIDNGYRFIIITGGGKLIRKYNQSVRQIVKPKEEELDWLGIMATRINAELVRICFANKAYEKILLDPEILPKTKKPIIIGGGFKPGNSSDLAAVRVAKSIKAKKIINLSNIDYVYDKDPHKYKNAWKITKSSWSDFLSILPKKWQPGINAPFDPVAAREAKDLGLEVVIMNGQKINNLGNYLDNKNFIGSVIK